MMVVNHVNRDTGMKNFNYTAMNWGLFWGLKDKLYIPSIVNMCISSVGAYFVWYYAQFTETFVLAIVVLFTFGLGGSFIWGYMGNE